MAALGAVSLSDVEGVLAARAAFRYRTGDWSGVPAARRSSAGLAIDQKGELESALSGVSVPTATTVLLTLAVFAVGFGVGWRFRVSGLFPFLGLLVMFGVLDYVVEEITLWPMTYWVMLDLIVIQVGYLVGAGSGQLMGERRSRNLRQPI